MKARMRKRSIQAISSVIGAIIMISVTLTVGFGAWAWASGAARNSELSFGNAIGTNINYLKETYSIVNANFSSTATQNVTVWLYNSGNTTVYIKQIWISNVTSITSEAWSNTTTSLSKTQVTNCGYCLQLSPGQVTPIQLKVTSSFKAGILYQFKAVGLYGNAFTYQQTR